MKKITIDEVVKDTRANIVTIDNIRAIKKAVKDLINNAHTQIILFAGSSRSSHIRERIECFIDAFSESTLVFKKDTFIPAGSKFDEGYRKTMEDFWDKKPSAILCFNEQTILK